MLILVDYSAHYYLLFTGVTYCTCICSASWWTDQHTWTLARLVYNWCCHVDQMAV